MGVLDRYMHGLERPHPDLFIARLAARQYGVVALWQLAEIGLDADAAHNRLRCGRFHQVHVGVYAVGHPVLGRHGRWMAAVLAYGPAAVLSYRDAAALWRVRRDARRAIDVTADRYTRNARPGIDLHRPRRFDPLDATTHEGIPVTTVARTLVDLAAVVSLQDLTRAWDEAERLQIFDLRAVEEVRARSRGRRGLKKIDALLAQSRPLPPMTRSDLELAALELFRAAGLPEPAVNVWIDDMEVDFLWREQRVVVELDGAAYHRTQTQRDIDDARTARLQLLGYRVVRVSDRRLIRDPDGVVAEVRGLLDGGGGA